MQEQAVLPTFPKRNVGRRKGGRGRQLRRMEWISSQPQQPSPGHRPGIPGRTFYLRATNTARRGAGKPSMVRLWSAGLRKSLND